MKRKLLLILLILFSVFTARSQVDVTLYKQFNGQYDFTFVGNTLNQQENGINNICQILTSSSAVLALDPNHSIIAAYLYWAGSGTGDFDILLNGQPVSAERTFAATYTLNRHFFSAYADVTALVNSMGSTTYTVSELDLTNVINTTEPNNIYCPSGLNFGGWAIFVVYKDGTLPLNQINLYDGLQFVPDEINILLPSLNVIDNAGAKIGFIAWEGDQQLAVEETLYINDVVMSNDLNPANNAFNGTNTETLSNNLYNMDLDVYNIEDIIAIGDTQAEIRLESGQDFVMVNAIITKLNSELPDATIVIDNITKQCNSNIIEVEYTVYNINSTDALPAGTPISMYANNSFIGSAVTQAEIPIGGSESGTITLTIPANITGSYELWFAVDDLGGTGASTVEETDENNNDYTVIDTLWYPPLEQPADITACETFNGSGVAVFDFSGYEESLKNVPTDIITFYLTEADAQVPQNPITNPDSFTSTANPQQIFVRLQDVNGCVTIGSFNLIAVDCLFPDATITATIIQECNSHTIQVQYTVNNLNSNDVLPAGTPIAFYVNGALIGSALTQTTIPIGGSENGTITLTLPATIVGDFQLVLAVDDTGNGTGIITETNETNNTFTINGNLWVSPPLEQPADITACETFNGSGVAVFDFSGYEESLKNSPTDVVTFYLTEADALVPQNNITNPDSFTSTQNPQEIFVRLQDANGCFTIGSFNLIAVDCLFPDATVVINDITAECSSRKIEVNYAINNFDSNDILPAGTPVSIYINGEFLEYTETLLDIPIGGSENGTITLTIPNDIPLTFELTFVADDTGNGTGIVTEINETNNAFTVTYTLPIPPVITGLEDIEECNRGMGSGIFDFSHYEQDLKTSPTDEVFFYPTLTDAQQDTNRITNPASYLITSSPQEIFVRLSNTECYSIGSFMLYTKNCPPQTYNYITPNGDGINDSFFVEGLRGIFLNFKMTIYNRWGALVWQGDNSKADWDGVASETKVGEHDTTVPAGTYYFVLELNDPDYPEPIVGWVYVSK